MKNVLSVQSSVVYGYAGNKAAVLPMQLSGIDVWPFYTVQFSNHTQYGMWQGMAMPHGELSRKCAHTSFLPGSFRQIAQHNIELLLQGVRACRRALRRRLRLFCF